MPVSHGYGLIGAYAIVFTSTAVGLPPPRNTHGVDQERFQITNQLFGFLTFRLMVKTRGALVGVIYRDMLAIRAESKNSSSAMTLMSTDVDRICMSARWVVDMIPNLVQIGLEMWLLSLQLGAVCVAPLIVAMMCAGGTAAIAKLIPVRQRRWIAAIQKRVGITSDVIGVMKGVKMLGISDPLSKQIQGLRDFEIAESRKFRKLQIFLIAMSKQVPSSICPLLIPTEDIIPMVSMSAVTFTVFAIVAKISGSGALVISPAFTSLSLLGILVMPGMWSFERLLYCCTDFDSCASYFCLWQYCSGHVLP